MFVEVLSEVFKGKNAPSDLEITEAMKVRAEIPYDLLSAFKTLPGLHDGVISAAELSEWVTKVRSPVAAKGLGEIGDQRIGFVFAHAPQNPDEAFLARLQRCAMWSKTLRQNRSSAALHSSASTSVASIGKWMNEGGAQEREYAERYQRWADATTAYSTHLRDVDGHFRGLASPGRSAQM